MILVTGATGFVGGTLMRLCRDVVACPSLRDATEDDVRRIVSASGADTIVHTAAIADIGVCEQHPDASYHANVQLPVWLANASKGKKLICFSSDQVYNDTDTTGPFTEEDAKPKGVYASHKLEMEQRVLEIDPDAVMLRAQWMYDSVSAKPNYFLNVVHASAPLRFSSRQHRGITYVREVADNLDAIVRLPGGAYNFGSETAQSMYDVTRTFLALIGKTTPLEDAPPPHDLWMNCDKARRHSVIFRRVEDGLAQCARDCGLI